MEKEPKIFENFQNLEAKKNLNILYELSKEKDKRFELHDELVTFANKLKRNFSDYNDYMLYHVLISSTIPKGAASKFDFPGEYSVEEFLEEKIKEYS